jgi:hypothetical protein
MQGLFDHTLISTFVTYFAYHVKIIQLSSLPVFSGEGKKKAYLPQSWFFAPFVSVWFTENKCRV